MDKNFDSPEGQTNYCRVEKLEADYRMLKDKVDKIESDLIKFFDGFNKALGSRDE